MRKMRRMKGRMRGRGSRTQSYRKRKSVMYR
jgi:hypothetical protein